MTRETLNKIVWWIPIKKVRDNIREKYDKKIDNNIIIEENTKDPNTIWIENCIEQYNKLNTSNRFPIDNNNLTFYFNENISNTSFNHDYTYHPAWAARCLAKIKPKKHVDISSIIYLNAILSAFMDVEFYDYRPPKIDDLSGLTVGKADLTNLFFEDNSIESISCLNVVEHVGLGRYGDEIDPDGDIKSIKELIRVTKIGGNILFNVPIGIPRLAFNGHRIYSYDMIIDYFKDCELIDYSLIICHPYIDGINIVNNPSKDFLQYRYSEISKPHNNVGHIYDSGCFWFKKIR